MKTLILGLLVSLPLFAANPLVFMREKDESKQIVISMDGQEEVLSSGTDWHLYPDLTADGRMVTWVEGTSGEELHVALYDRTQKSRERFEVCPAGMTLHPRFTKNGRELFFSMGTPTGNKIAHFVPADSRTVLDRTESDGTKVWHLNPRQITHDGQGFFPRPSSDGAFVIYQRNLNGKKEIIEHDLINKSFKVLAEGMAPALSPDERFVAYTSKINGSWDVWMIDRETGEVKNLTQDPADEMAPTFTADNKVSFSSNRTGHFQIYQLDGTNWKRLTNNEAEDYAPNFSGNLNLQQKELAPIPGALRSSFGALSHQGKVWTCGGHAGHEHTYPPESFTDVFHVYDPTTGAWTELAPRPRKAHGFQLAARGNYIYAFGGFTYAAENDPQWRSLDEIDRYDITTNTWATVGKMPRRRSSNVVVVVGDLAFIIGGWDSTPRHAGDLEGTFQHAVDVFDMATETVSIAPWEVPLPLRRAFSAVENNGKIMLIGGLGVGSSHFDLLANITEIDPMSGASKELAPLPFATFAPAAGMLSGQLAVFGGMFMVGQDYEYVSHVYLFNQADNSWSHSGRFLKETKGFAQVVPLNGGLGVLGGHHYYADRDEPVATFEFWRLNNKTK